MKRAAFFISAFLIATFLFTGFTGKTESNNRIELAILLDTSGSMDGLIEQAKTQLWQIVNELATSKKNGEGIEIFVALYEYGNDGIPADEGHIRQIVPLTSDLDKISEELFKLTTNGGSEYCGQVIKSAVEGLQWSESNEDLKLIFIAGNEPFTQGSYDYKVTCKEAIENGIIVNTIFCGNFQEGINTNWKDGADLADGKYMNIDHNQELVQIETPMDDEILRLNEELNKTYLGYGSIGMEREEMQATQDQNSMGSGKKTAVERSITKSTSQYRNSSWDLVDATEEGEVELDDIAEEELPEEMKGMTTEEKEAYIKEMGKKRGEIQEKINQLSKDRREYIADELKNMPENTLEQVMIKTVREQAEANNFTFEQ